MAITSANMQDTEGKAVKVVLLGNSGAGKSSLAKRFVYDEFDHYSDSTIGASFFSKHLSIKSGDQLSPRLQKEKAGQEEEEEVPEQFMKFHVWDTAGQEKYHSLAPMYYRGARAAILVFDICNSPSYEALKSWLERLKDCGPKGLTIIIVGNKCDLDDGRQVERERAESFAKSENCIYIETSARENINVEMIFQEIAKELIALQPKEDSIIGSTPSKGITSEILGLGWKDKSTPYSCGC